MNKKCVRCGHVGPSTDFIDDGQACAVCRDLDPVTAAERNLEAITRHNQLLQHEQHMRAQGQVPPPREVVPPSTMSDQEVIEMRAQAEADVRARGNQAFAEGYRDAQRYGGPVGLSRRARDGFRRWRYRRP